jgi:lipid II:glycine glycyltransferase (peptidoglycan interpeptide bridge formation enzyme)
MNIKVVDTLDENVWREFVYRQPQGNIFQTPEMYQVFSRAKGYRPELRAAITEDGQPLALLQPVQVTLRNGPLRRLTTRAIVYGSILCTPDEAGKQALEAMLRQYIQVAGRESLFTQLRHQSDISDYRDVLDNCGFDYQDHLNYLIDLDGPTEEIFNRVGPRTRKHIRREIKKGELSVEEVNQPEQIKAFYALTQKSYQGAHVPIADLSLFEAAFEILHPRNMIKFWLVRLGDTYIASSVELTYKDVVYGWYGGVDRDYSSCTPTEFLTWHILKWGAEHGYRIYDFGGAGLPEEEYGVRDFKSKFGGRLVCFGRSTVVHTPLLLRLSTLGYSVLRYFIKS